MSEPSSVEKFSRGEAISVGLDRIERALSALWKTAGSSDGGSEPAALGHGGAALGRAALWNIVVAVHGAASLDRTRRLIDEMALSVPARVIILYQTADAGGRDITATIESNVVSPPGGVRTVYAEEITLQGGPGSEQHFGALVRSLQIPGLPTATFWIDAALAEDLLFRELLPLSDRLVLDTGRCERAGDLTTLQRLSRLGKADVTDLGWLRLINFRLLFAGLFDPPVGGGPLAAAQRVMIHYRPQRLASALMMTGWLGCQLGWEPLAAATAPNGELALRFRRGAGGGAAGEVAVSLVPSEDHCGTSGLVSLELFAADGPGGAERRFAIGRTATNHARLEAPVAPPRTIKLDSRSDAELAIAALGPRGRDPLLSRCLAVVAQLSDLAEHTGGR